MEHYINLKGSAFTAIGVMGAFIANMLGGWDTALQTLCIFMVVDYITGLIVAGVFHKSGKTSTGALQSNACWKGLLKKGMTLLIILVAEQLDLVTGTTFVRDGAIIAYTVNECLSIIENAGLMGIPIPNVLVEAMELLKKKNESDAKKVE